MSIGSSLFGASPKDFKKAVLSPQTQGFSVPYSPVFEDVYFNPQDGLAETQHVFLSGNNLPARWHSSSQAHFIIAETGFGTGLNFFATCAMFEQTAPVHNKLHYISFEKYPLSFSDLYSALSPWHDLFMPYIKEMKNFYPLMISGFHRMHISPRIQLTLIFEDVNDAIGHLDAEIDAWYLDGFKPSTNPKMWSDVLFNTIGRLSSPGASFSTFTAAGFVKRGLQGAGFTVQKIKGFGTKREMLIGIKS